MSGRPVGDPLVNVRFRWADQPMYSKVHMELLNRESPRPSARPVARSPRCRGWPIDTVLVIPGIGGHPAFHEDLVAGLREWYAVHTAPHVGFHDEPCADWNRYVHFWTEQLHHAAGGSATPPAIVGISFGAHVGHAVRLQLPAGSVQSLTLVSYRHLTALERRVLRALPRAPRTSSYLVGTALLRLSEVQTGDRERLRSLRRALYDDERRVRARLMARLTSLAAAPPLLSTPGDATSFIFGADEKTLQRRHAQRGHPAVLVPGAHSVSVRNSPHLLRAVEAAIYGGAHRRGLALGEPDEGREARLP